MEMNGKKDEQLAFDIKSKMVDEHLWIAGTIVVLNTFIYTEATKTHPFTAKIFSVIITLYAIFLIVQRSAAHADKLIHPEEQLKNKAEKDKTYKDKGKETLFFIKKVFLKHLLFVIFEFSGAFFYILMATVSCLAVLFL